MKSLLTAASLLVLTLSTPLLAEESSIIAYPTTDAPSFIIQVPDSWKMTAAEEEGDFFHLDGPTGAIFSFRTIPGDSGALDAAIDDSFKHIESLFSDVQIDEPKDWTPDGLAGFYATGVGKDKDGTVVRIGVAWCALNDGKIVQMWFVTDADDAPGLAGAEAIANSLQSPK